MSLILLVRFHDLAGISGCILDMIVVDLIGIELWLMFQDGMLECCELIGRYVGDGGMDPIIFLWPE